MYQNKIQVSAIPSGLSNHTAQLVLLKLLPTTPVSAKKEDISAKQHSSKLPLKTKTGTSTAVIPEMLQMLPFQPVHQETVLLWSKAVQPSTR